LVGQASTRLHAPVVQQRRNREGEPTLQYYSITLPILYCTSSLIAAHALKLSVTSCRPSRCDVDQPPLVLKRPKQGMTACFSKLSATLRPHTQHHPHRPNLPADDDLLAADSVSRLLVR
jgi:hypothetical protein